MVGSNDKNQLGVNVKSNTGSPYLVESLKNMNVVQVSCGYDFTCCIVRGLDSPQVYSWGNNKYGQLGHEACASVRSPKLITAFTDLESKIA